MDASTPGLLFPAISLLMLAYTNRFLALANLMRQLISKFEEFHSASIYRQIINLKFRINLLRYIQTLGVSSLIFCSFALFFLFFGLIIYAKISFVRSLDIEIAKIQET
jgi:hypothetical protein